MMHLFVRLLLFVTVAQCLTSGENVENSVSDQLPEKSRFKKFLNIFGIGTAKQFNPHSAQGFSPYGYPCPLQTTTTTPAPIVLSPLLCPYPPMMPGQSLNGGVSPPSLLPLPRPGSLDNLLPPPPPGSVDSLPPPPGGLDNLPPPPGSLLPPPPGSLGNLPPPPGQLPLPPPGQTHPRQPQPPGLLDPRPPPPPPFPGQGPLQIPGHQSPFTLMPGQKVPQMPFPGGMLMPLPNQYVPKPLPGQSFVQPGQPGQGEAGVKPFPVFPGQLIPSNIEQPAKPVEISPNNPTLITPIHPSDPTKPVLVDPLNPENPIKVTPVITNPLDPIKVNPAIIDPTKPIQVDPIKVDPSQPVLIDPVQPGKPFIVPHQPFQIKPNQPLLIDPFRPPPAINIDSKGFTRPSPFLQPYGPTNVLINPGIPDKPLILPPPPALSNISQLNHPGPLPPFPKPPVDSGTNQPIPGGDFPGQTLFNSGNGLPPAYPPNPFAPYPLPNGSGPQQLPNGIAFPNNTPNGNPFLPIPKPPDTFGPMCSNPNLKPYVPPGFHFTSVNQFMGMGPVILPGGHTLDLLPCPTMDMLKKLEFSIMRHLIESSGLLPLIDHTKNYTLFVPSDASFRRLPRWFRDSLDADKKLKKALVLNHLVKEDLPLARLENEELILSARPGGNRLRINIYQPGSSYRTITVDGSEVEKGDILTTHGRIHILQKVLMPNLPRNAAQFLSEKLEFESFWNLVKQAEMVHNFQDTRPFTLFIPVNEAVAKLNHTTLLTDKDKLRNFIQYHMVNGSFYSNGLINNEFLLTNYEKEIKMQVVTDGFTKSLYGINGVVRVIKSDITLTTGVAHVIEQCISEEPPFYIYPQSDEFKNEFGVMRRSFRVNGEEKNIEDAF